MKKKFILKNRAKKRGWGLPSEKEHGENEKWLTVAVEVPQKLSAVRHLHTYGTHVLTSPTPHRPPPHTHSSSPPSSRVSHISIVYSVRKKNKCSSCLSLILQPIYLRLHYPLFPPEAFGFCVKPPLSLRLVAAENLGTTSLS